MNVIFIGESFYNESGTSMSSIYEIEEETLKRTDWGFVQKALGEGESVNIRPANDSEMLWAYKKLAEIQKNIEN